jgi:hypothetical protein
VTLISLAPDQLFGCLSHIIKHADDSIQSAQDICGLLRSRLARTFEEKGLQFVVQYVETVRPWEQLLPQNVRFYGAYRTRGGVEAPHSFTFIRRESRPPSQEAGTTHHGPPIGTLHSVSRSQSRCHPPEILDKP